MESHQLKARRKQSYDNNEIRQLQYDFSGCEVHILRHGETDWNAQEKLQGSTDIVLNEKGIKQVMKIHLVR